jgi:hypothetical protein
MEGALLPLLEKAVGTGDDESIFKVFKDEIGDSISTIFISPDSDPVVYLYSRLFHPHEVALSHSLTGSDESEICNQASNAFFNRFGFQVHQRDKYLTHAMENIVPAYPGVATRLFNQFQNKEAGSEVVEIAPVEKLRPYLHAITEVDHFFMWSTVNTKPVAGSLINRMLSCFDVKEGGWSGPKSKHLFLSLAPEVMTILTADVDIRQYMILRMLFPSEIATRLLKTEETYKTRVLKSMGITLDTKQKTINSFRRILSYHPKLIGVFFGTVMQRA